MANEKKAKVQIEIDASDLESKCMTLRQNLSEASADAAIRHALDKTARGVKRILKEEIPDDYEAKPGWITQAVGKPRMGGAGSGIMCVIPIKGTKGTVGSRFAARGGARGWQSLVKKYRVTAKILKGNASTLPATMEHQGGFPPFRNLGSRLGGVTFTRKTKKRNSFVRVSGLAVPQMAMNRSADDIKAQIHDELEKQLNAQIGYMLK